MDIEAIFDPAFSGPPGEAVWIVDSAANRAWFEAAMPTLHPDSAIFSLRPDQSPDDAIRQTTWNVQEHFPQWRRIVFTGLAPGARVPAALADEGVWENGPGVLILHRGQDS